MAFDGIFLHQLKKELSVCLSDARIEKIYQPTRDELVLLVRKKGFNGKLFVCARPSFGKLYFTNQSLENPEAPPMFCMLLRKHLSGAKFLSINDNGFERMVTLCFENVNEMGDRVILKLVIELLGSKTNIILVGNDGLILDSTRRTGFDTDRLIQPGAKYTLPPKQDKLSINSETSLLVEKITAFDGSVAKAICDSVEGMSPLVAREIVFNAQIEFETMTASLNQAQKQMLAFSIDGLKQSLENGTPTLLIKDDQPYDFTFLPIKQYGEAVKCETVLSFSELLDSFFLAKGKNERMKSHTAELSKQLNTIKVRTARKIAVRKEELKKCENAEQWRIYGELIKANLHNIEKGMNSVTLENYYDDMKPVKVPLNITLSPVENSQRYFKEYRKSCTALATLGDLIASAEAELQYIESVIDALSRAESLSEISEIKSELSEEGYLPRLQKQAKKQKQFKFEEHLSPSGYPVLVGKNNKQNEELTLRVAAKNDMWFHVKNIPGSHVVVMSGGQELTEKDILFAAGLAAKNSKAAQSSNVPVDYTYVKQIKKPSGAKCGMVIYHTNNTVYVTPVT